MLQSETRTCWEARQSEDARRSGEVTRGEVWHPTVAVLLRAPGMVREEKCQQSGSLSHPQLVQQQRRLISGTYVSKYDVQGSPLVSGWDTSGTPCYSLLIKCVEAFPKLTSGCTGNIQCQLVTSIQSLLKINLQRRIYLLTLYFYFLVWGFGKDCGLVSNMWSLWRRMRTRL